MKTVKALENLVRSTAEHLGYDACSKSRTTGRWTLAHPNGNYYKENLTLEEVCQALEADLEAEQARNEDLLDEGPNQFPLLFGTGS